MILGGVCSGFCGMGTGICLRSSNQPDSKLHTWVEDSTTNEVRIETAWLPLSFLGGTIEIRKEYTTIFTAHARGTGMYYVGLPLWYRLSTSCGCPTT